MHTRYADITPYDTLDGSSIRELMHPAVHGNQGQSLAEAVIAPQQETRLHRHACSEEIYHVSTGHGRMQLGAENLVIGPGDTVCIPPGTAHKVRNTGDQPLHLLCVCTPAYRHDDTELL